MKYPFRWFEWLAMLALAAGSLAGKAVASEPVDSFLAALRTRLYFDEALDYLELLKSNPHLPDEVKQKAQYEQGMTLLESAAGQSDFTARGTQLSKASEWFEEFHKHFPQHRLAALAKTQIGNIWIERGRAEVQAADPAAARKCFEAARDPFAAAEKELDAQLQKIPKLIAPGEKDLQTLKRQLAGDLAQVLLLRASIDDELAKTFEANSPEAKKHLRAAARSYAKLYEAYRTRAVGLLARLWEGRCHQEMGEIKQALGCFQELMDLPASPDTRDIKTKSTRHALECWTGSGEKKYQEAIERGERWEKESLGNPTDADALAIRYLTALAYQAQSNGLPAKDPNRKKLALYARQYVSPVATHPGEYQRPAKMLLVALGGNKDSKKSSGEPGTFAEAFERANQALERMQEATAKLQAPQQETDKATLDAMRKQKSAEAALAGQSLRLALSLADGKTGLEDLNSARWYLCFLAWDAGDYYEAAVLGEFLARHYPDSPAGRRGARVALASFVRLYGSSKADDKDFETAQIQRVADMIFKRWPNEEEADETALTLLNFAASQQQLDKVLEYLGKISTNSPRRGQAELRAGPAVWSAYLRSSQAADPQRPPQEKLDAMKKQAQEVLAQGIARQEAAGEVDATLAAAVFAMAQICVETGQPEKAISWLEHPKMGPLTLVKAGSPVAAREGFAAETYKIALRAYIAVTPQQLKKAEEAMDALEKLVQKSGDVKASENLTAIYISLGRELQQHLQALRKSGKVREREAVSKAFEVFLDRVTQRETGGSFASLHWVAETYYGLGSGFDENGAPPSSRANVYFQKAITAYQRMLEVAAKDPKYQAQPESLLGVRLRLADCYHRSGNFDDAIKTLVTVLRQKPMLITAQVQAAEIYQDLGASDSKGYALAINGSNPGKDGKNTIWGWNKISQIVSKAMINNPKYEDTFHLSRLSMAEARYRFALGEKDKDQRTKILEWAKQDLWYTYKLYPNLGGEKKSAQYDRMLKQIQKSLGASETGLTEFKERDAAAASAD
jgi:tetratricopeptide (TPR) repeat protein